MKKKITCINVQKFIDWCGSEDAKQITEKRRRDAVWVLGYYVGQLEEENQGI